MYFQQCDFNLLQVANHLVNYVDVLKTINGSTLNVNALLYMPTNETQTMNTTENNLQEVDVKTNEPKKQRKRKKKQNNTKKNGLP